MDTSLTAEEVSRKVKERTGFELHDWQVEAVQHVLAGKDVLITAAATAGKTTASLAAAMLMEKGDTGLVVCPSDEPGHSALVSRMVRLSDGDASPGASLVASVPGLGTRLARWPGGQA